MKVGRNVGAYQRVAQDVVERSGMGALVVLKSQN
jgi:hypothetical protein